MKATIIGGGFHNVTSIDIIIDENKILEGYAPDGGDIYPLTKSQIERISNHFCGISDCTCGSSPIFEYDPDKYGIDTRRFQI